MTDAELQAAFSEAANLPHILDGFDLNDIQDAEITAGIHDPANHALRVRWTNALSSAVRHRCPVNKVGTPVISDLDKLCATPREKAIAFVNTLSK